MCLSLGEPVLQDPAKYARAQRLLKADREIKAARKVILRMTS